MLILDNADRKQYKDMIGRVPTFWLKASFDIDDFHTVVWMKCPTVHDAVCSRARVGMADPTTPKPGKFSVSLFWRWMRWVQGHQTHSLIVSSRDESDSTTTRP